MPSGVSAGQSQGASLSPAPSQIKCVHRSVIYGHIVVVISTCRVVTSPPASVYQHTPQPMTDGLDRDNIVHFECPLSYFSPVSIFRHCCYQVLRLAHRRLRQGKGRFRVRGVVVAEGGRELVKGRFTDPADQVTMVI